jgi:biopolymer transport protein ExbB/TolQ
MNCVELTQIGDKRMEQEIEKRFDQLDKKIDQLNKRFDKLDQIEKRIVEEIRLTMSTAIAGQDEKIEQQLKLIGYYSRLEQVRQHEFRITQLENLAGISKT